MTRLVGIAGSLRRDSFNRALLGVARLLLPEGASLEILSIDDVPLYHGDLEDASGVPAPVEALKDAVAAADGLVLATPEYNGSVPGVLKNAVDWMSRPIEDQPRVLHGKRVALLGASPSPMGTSSAQNAWLPVLRSLRMVLWTERGSFLVGGAHQALRDGGLEDPRLRGRLEGYLAGFVAFVRD